MSDDARYILAKKIARGGMAEIFLGKQIGEDGFQRLCAIKRILPHYSNDQEFIQMFRDEAHICKRLQHANIVRVEGFEEVEGSYAIIMEYVDGADLRTLLHAIEQAKKKLPLPMSCFVIAEAARGLHYAHTKVDEITQQALGIVHRDISPQNILVSFEGEIKITDFGIADAESKLTETRPGIVKGKYSYMSPEQISAKPVDCRSDVFALSIVLWEMLAMRRLFQGENEVDTIQRVKNCRIDVELRQANPEVDEELDVIVKKGLARDPKKRYRTAADFEKDLRRYMSRKFPDFTPEDLGNFLKKSMETRRTESAAEIKRTLTETNLRPGKKATNAKGEMKSSGTEVELEANSAPISLQRSAINHAHAQPARSNLPVPIGGANRIVSLTPRPLGTRGNSPMPRMPSSRRVGGMGKALALALLATFFLAAGAFMVTTLAAKPRLGALLLRTQPTRVRIMIDSKPVAHGRYVHASAKKPYAIQLAPGDHSLLVTRPGYSPFRYEFSVENGEKVTKDDIVLREKSALAALKIRNKTPEKGLSLDINDGYFIVHIVPGQNSAVAPDVLQGKTYKMKVHPDDDSKEFVCPFVPKSTSWRTPDDLVIDVKARNARFLVHKGAGVDKQFRRVVLIWITVCVWTMAIVLASNRLKLAAKSAVTVTLFSHPTSVKVTIDGDKQEDGAYIETPTKFLLKPGRHKLKIARDGFIAHIVSVEGDAGDVFRMDDVVLAKNPDQELATVDIAEADGQALHVDIDDTLQRGETPVNGVELLAGSAHMLTIYPKWPSREMHSRCRFTPPGTPPGSPYKIKIKQKNGKLKLSGCDPLTTAKHK